MPNKLAVGELIGRVLDVRVRLFRALPAVEVHFERRTIVGSFLSVNVAFEVRQELLQSVNGISSGHIVNED